MPGRPPRFRFFPHCRYGIMMDDAMLDLERITIPRWTIARDTRSLGCVFCHSIIVRVTTDSRQIAFCSCRLVEFRLLPKPKIRKINSTNP